MTRKVYDKVWIMHYNVPKEYLVYSIIQRMDLMKTCVVVSYSLVDGFFAADTSSNPEIFVDESDMFDSKEELINSL